MIRTDRIMKNLLIMSSAIVFTLLIWTIPQTSAASLPSGSTSGDYTTIDVIALILYMVLALFFSFMCSIAEAVLLNISPSYIAELQERDSDAAAKLKKIRQENVDESLAAILTMNTIAHTIGAIGSGAKATIIFGSVWFGLFSAIMTLLILFLSEIIPKTIGVVFWRKLVSPVIRYIQILTFVLYPFLWISEGLTKLIAKDKSVHVFSREEFVALAGVGKETGAINIQESTILQNLFRLGSLTVQDIFTPRTVIVGFNQNLTISEVLNHPDSQSFSRIIIHEGDLDKVTGFVLKDELLLFKAQGNGDMRIDKLKRDIIIVPLKTTLSKLLEKLLNEKQHIALVIDEFGTKGVVTIEDILETLLGMEIVDESDRVEDMRILAKERWENRMEALGIDVSKSSDNDFEPTTDLEGTNDTIGNDQD